ncbi:MAG: FeoA family protein [Candidatus Auribacterota bacterium]|nr:FeoA family protein [Candidatus Auribacterota bacterium]
MKPPSIPLTLIEPNREVTLVAVHGGRGLRRRLTDMGLNEGMSLRVVQAHSAGPCVIAVGGTRLMLGHRMAQKILVQPG